MQLTNDGDGDAFDVRAFGHNCIVYEAEWEKRPDGRWTNKEVTMYPAMPSNGETANLIILPPEGHDEIPCDAEVCIHWKRSPTRLRRCGYTHTPIAGDEDWWNDKDWQIRHRVAERLKLVVEHRRFHHNPKDAETTPNQPISMPNLTPTPDAQARN
ncbi:hypothetical protein PT282_01255 [Bifidobacterium sp. ESL0763]|uniref:hypothetical protein n=1 Tax=Bifidobacterium sp. ESL0763 TaxID=2983227 RepID=UPI0023F8F3E3|nr:hypothetical protein [Bifidobacterium sp. ESL0763]MDF7663310.1 hypothetical protein [Bifidobacterium sp. ESL0763]